MSTDTDIKLAALQQAVQEAKTHAEILQLLTAISAIESNASATLLNKTAHSILGIAINPDRLRDLLQLMETRRPGALDFIERTLHELCQGEPFPADADGETWEA